MLQCSYSVEILKAGTRHGLHLLEKQMEEGGGEGSGSAVTIDQPL